MGNISSCLTVDTLRSIFSFVVGEAKYIWNLDDNLEALQTEFNKLIRTRDDLLNEVKIAEQQPRKRRTNQVIGWLERVQKVESKVAELQKAGYQEVDKLCLGGFCSKDLTSGYDIGKKVHKLKEEVSKLKDERGDIKDVAEKVPEDPAVAIPVERTIVGQEYTFQKVWRCLRAEQARIIGIYGVGGVGKTTLLKQINNNFCREQHNFDVVIWVVVSRDPKFEHIQDDIGKRIGLSDESWKSRSLKEKASDISKVLSQKNFLLLLDDMWQPIELTELGVPLQSLNIESKLIFTTRSLDVCGQMEADEKFEVECLTHAKAWKLFQEKVGRDVLSNHTEISELAEALARECRGLPLALITIGRAMAYKKKPEDWKHAIKVLRTSASKFSGMEETVFWRLKFSYDSLFSDTIRSCFLYCCLFPEDFWFDKEDLIDCWIDEGFANDFEDGFAIISDLLRACLLEEAGDHVKMHDVIRDMALWIACKIEKEKENFLVWVSARLTKSPKIEEWKGVKRISLMENKIESLSTIPTCPSLLTLILVKNNITTINNGFFQFMPSLRVLSLAYNRNLTEVPSGISCLVSLEHLNLSFTSILELPLELKELINLRYLNLEGVERLFEIPPQLLSSFSKLRVLRMRGCSTPDIAKRSNCVLFKDASLLINEFLSLDKLKVLSIDLYSSRAFQIFFTFQKLLPCTKSLGLADIKNPMAIDVLHLAYMKNLKRLELQRCDFKELKFGYAGVQKVLQVGFPSLGRVFLYFCSSMKDLTWLAFAPNLKIIDMWYCKSIEEIVKAEKLSETSEIMGKLNLFGKLKYLRIVGLTNLTSIYLNPLPFPQLKMIIVSSCPMLKKLPLNSNSATESKIVIKGRKQWWEQLQWEDQATQDAFQHVSYLKIKEQ